MYFGTRYCIRTNLPCQQGVSKEIQRGLKHIKTTVA